MNEIHKPSRAQAIGFFFFSLLLAAGMLLWYFFLNKGVLEITGAFPFEVYVANQSKICDTSPCTFKLDPRNYTVNVKKENFFNDEKKIKINRGETYVLEAKFAYIPTIKEITVRPAFMNSISPSERRIISPKKDRALVIGKTDVSIVELSGGKKIKLAILPSQTPTWMGENIAYVEHTEEKDEIRLRASDKTETIAIFSRPINKPALYGNGDGTKLIVRDTKENGTFSYYLVDAKANTRQVLTIATDAKNPVIVGDTLFFETDINDVAQLAGYSLSKINSKIELKGISSNALAEKSPGVYVFFSNENLENKSAAQLGRSITDILFDPDAEAIENDLAKKIYLIEYDSPKETFKLLISMDKNEEEIKNLVISPDSNHIFFEKGVKIFQVSLVAN